MYPAWFEQRACSTVHNHLTGEQWDHNWHLNRSGLAGHLVEDLCLIEEGIAGGPAPDRLRTVLPSRWRLHGLGRPLANVREKVPLCGDRLARPVDRFMAHVRPGHIAGAPELVSDGRSDIVPADRQVAHRA